MNKPVSNKDNNENNDDARIGLEDAYAVDGPDDNRRLYAAWATTYDNDFVAATGYIYHRRVAEIFSEGFSPASDAVLDVGCGTGVVGQELRRLGISTIDGIDISAEMLDEARSRTDPGGAVYRRLIEADLTGPVGIASDLYAGIVSAGTFTHGHLGPDSLSELFRLAAPGARCAIGINSAHFDALGFRAQLDQHCSDEVISEYELEATPVYQDANEDDPNSIAFVVVLTVL